MTGQPTFTQTVRYLFALLVTFSVLVILSGSSMLFVSRVYTEAREGPVYETQLQQRLPQCIIIGAMKGGTKALIEFMGLHPNVKINPRDVHFFNNDTAYSQGLGYYREQMPYSYPEDVTMEKSPAYFASADARRRIKSFKPEVKLVVVLRNPITRAMSHFLQLERHGLTGLLRFEDLVIDPSTGSVDANASVITPSLYVDHISEWLALFPRSQLHIVDGEDLVQNPVSELRRLESFLGLNHWITDLDFFFDTKKGFYCSQIMGCLGGSKGRDHPSIDPLVFKKLNDFFKPYNQRLVKLIEMEFKWL